jgi:hypothetical protein
MHTALFAMYFTFVTHPCHMPALHLCAPQFPGTPLLNVAPSTDFDRDGWNADVWFWSFDTIHKKPRMPPYATREFEYNENGWDCDTFCDRTQTHSGGDL